MYTERLLLSAGQLNKGENGCYGVDNASSLCAAELSAFTRVLRLDPS